MPPLHPHSTLLNQQHDSSRRTQDHPSRRLSLLGDPSTEPSGKFLLASHSEVRSYQACKPTRHQIHYRPICSRSDLPSPYNCLDWTTAHQSFDLLAAGTPAGRAFLVPLPHSSSKPEESHPSITFSTSPSTRSCNSIAFDPSGQFLAIALERTRDYGLQIYRVDRLLALSQSSSASSSASNPNKFNPAPQNPRSTSSPLSSLINKKTHQLLLSPYHQANNATREPHPSHVSIAQAISSEAVLALEFMTLSSGSSQPTLLAASSSKLMRLYDLRSAGLKSSNSAEIPSISSPSPSIEYPTDVLNPVAQWPIRSVSGIKADPLVAHRFATWGDDGCVRIWDTRKTNECVLQFSEDDANLMANRIKPGRSTKTENVNSIISLTWSKVRKGVLATLSSNSTRIRVWDIVDGMPPAQSSRTWSDGSLLNPFGSRNSSTPASTGSVNAATSFSNQTVNFRKSTILPRGSSPSTSPREKVQIPNYTVFSTQLLKPFSRPNQSIIDVNIPFQAEPSAHTPPPDTYHLDFLGVSRDGQLEFIGSRPSGEASFGSMGQIAYCDRTRLRIPAAPPQINASSPMSADLSNTSTSSDKLPPDHPHHLGLDLKTCSFQEVAELRLANKFGRHLVDIPHPAVETPNTLTDLNTLPTKPTHGVLTNDISIVMMKRALSGYGPQPAKNKLVTAGDPVLGAFWEWITHSDKLSQHGAGLVNGYDFSFQGVIAIMKGFSPSSEAQRSFNSATASFNHATASQQGNNYQTLEFFTDRPSSSTTKPRVSSNGTSNHSKELSQYLKALRTFNHSHQVENFTISSEFSDQRQTALFLCGPDYNSGKIDEIVFKYEQLGMYGKACAIALFSGNTQRAITSLQRSDDLQLRTLAPTLATHLNTQRLSQARDPIFDEVCRQLSDERTSEPYLRAIFAYCATGDWHEVIDETGLPLKDRLAVGLRFLSDEEIFNWLESTARDSIQSGDLEGILLTGLNLSTTLNNITKKTDESNNSNKTRAAGKSDELGTGFELIQTYLNRSGDLQTAALASHLIVPAKIRLPTAERWIESYRKLLDRWMLFKVRIEFDISRGQKSRQLNGNVDNDHHHHHHHQNIHKASKNQHLLPPPQVLIRCQHCHEVVSDAANVQFKLNLISDSNSNHHPITTSFFPPSSSSSSSNTPPLPSLLTTSKKSAPGPIGFSVNPRQSNRCRVCGKSLPKCSICLIPLTVSDSHNSSIWAWCHRCRHVGHADHLREWQERGNSLCPVSGCDCHCWDSFP